jgi:hypothetical protein
MFLKTGYTPAGVPAVYEPRLAGLGQEDTTLNDILNSIPSLVATGGNVAATIIRAVNPTLPATPSSYAPSLAGGGSGLLLVAAGGLLLFALTKKRR